MFPRAEVQCGFLLKPASTFISLWFCLCLGLLSIAVRTISSPLACYNALCWSDSVAPVLFIGSLYSPFPCQLSFVLLFCEYISFAAHWHIFRPLWGFLKLCVHLVSALYNFWIVFSVPFNFFFPLSWNIWLPLHVQGMLQLGVWRIFLVLDLDSPAKHMLHPGFSLQWILFHCLGPWCWK